MFRKSFVFLQFLVFLAVFSAFRVSAECEHDFSPAENSSNTVYLDNMHHAYFCLNGCGCYGTLSGGEGAGEKCNFVFASEKPSTCVNVGKRIYTCTVCYINKEETLLLKEHSYEKVRKLATCTEAGYDIYTCTVCDSSYKNNFVQPLNHLSDGGVIEVLPDYGKAGVIRFSCRACDYLIESKSVPGLIRPEDNKSAVEPVNGFKVKSYGTSSVTLIWEKSEGAVSYNIYYSTDKKKWNTVSTDKTFITVKKLSSAKKYYFKISAVGTDTRSSISRSISVVTKPVKAVIVKVRSTKKSCATVEWKKQISVSGYEISFTYDSFGKKKTVKTVSVTKGNKKTLKKLKSGKKYRFRIRAYKSFGSKRIYGAYSKVKTLKIR